MRGASRRSWDICKIEIIGFYVYVYAKPQSGYRCVCNIHLCTQEGTPISRLIACPRAVVHSYPKKGIVRACSSFCVLCAEARQRRYGVVRGWCVSGLMLPWIQDVAGGTGKDLGFRKLCWQSTLGSLDKLPFRPLWVKIYLKKIKVAKELKLKSLT